MPVFHHHCITYQTVCHVVGAQCERKEGWKEGRKMREGGRNESVCAFVSLDIASELLLTGPASLTSEVL